MKEKPDCKDNNKISIAYVAGEPVSLVNRTKNSENQLQNPEKKGENLMNNLTPSPGKRAKIDSKDQHFNEEIQ